jgi:copper/silver efflux system protein
MAIETVMLMTIYLNLSMKNMVAEYGNSGQTITPRLIRDYIIKGATQRLRPFMMTVSVSLFGLFPILWATGAGSDVMLAITIPLIGGTISATIYVMLVTPVVFSIVKQRELKRKNKIELIDVEE